MSDQAVMLFEAVQAHFEAARARASAELYLYLKSPAGIGEHSDVVAEAIKKVEEIAAAKDALSTLDALKGSVTPEKFNHAFPQVLQGETLPCLT